MINQTNSNSGRSDIKEGWSVIVYGGDRRLLCTLHPSHGWIFLVGLVLGFLVAAAFYGNVAQRTPEPSSLEQSVSPAPLWLD